MTKKYNANLRVPYGQAVHDDKEKEAVIKVLDTHSTIIGKETELFEKRIAKLYNKKYGVMVNSGSSALLVALEVLNLPKDSEVITPVLTFATTVAPIIKQGLIPVFIDVEEGTYNINVDQIEKAITKKTKALMIPLLLGNMSDLSRIRSIAKKHNLIFIEDSCDTLGAKFGNKPTGSYSDMSVTSFYGSHIITAGGGGGILLVNNSKWADKAKVYRGWGRSSGLFSESEDIALRFRYEINKIPYDAKFIFDEIGYNFMPMELGSAFGNVQLNKLNKFRAIRKRNFSTLTSFFRQFEKYFILPKQHPKSETQWLAFPLTLRESTPFTRLELARYLEQNNIQTRPIFTGNILRQPAYKNIKYRSVDKNFQETEKVMRNGIVFGCHHGLGKPHIDKIKAVFVSFLSKY